MKQRWDFLGFFWLHQGSHSWDLYKSVYKMLGVYVCVSAYFPDRFGCLCEPPKWQEMGYFFCIKWRNLFSFRGLHPSQPPPRSIAPGRHQGPSSAPSPPPLFRHFPFFLVPSLMKGVVRMVGFLGVFFPNMEYMYMRRYTSGHWFFFTGWHAPRPP